MTPNRIGIVGTGSIVQQMHLPVLSVMPDAQVAWIADADASRASRVAAAYGLRAAALPPDPAGLPDCDAVLLAIPLEGRSAYYDAFARRGTPVLAEKPFALDPAQHRGVLARFAPSQLGCGYMRRFYAANRTMRRAIAEEWFGPLRALWLAEGGRTTRTGVDASFQDHPASRGGGIVLNLACHLIDLAFFLTEAADYRIERKEIVADGGTDRKVDATVLLDGVNGKAGQTCRLHLTVSWLDRQDNCVIADFGNAALRAPTRPSSEIELLTGPGRAVAGLLQGAERGATTSNQAFCLEWESFLAGLQTGTPGEIAASHSLVTARLMDDLLAGMPAQ